MFFLWVRLISLWVQMIFQEVQSRTNSQIHKWSHKHRSSRKVTSKHVCVHIVYLKSDDIDMNHKVLKFPPHYSKPKEKKPKRIQNERGKIVTKTVVQERNQVLIIDSFDFCETQSHIVHWLSSTIFTRLSIFRSERPVSTISPLYIMPNVTYERINKIAIPSL